MTKAGELMIVQFRQYRSKRIWEAVFYFGSEYENSLAALKVAWQYDAEIIRR